MHFPALPLVLLCAALCAAVPMFQGEVTCDTELREKVPHGVVCGQPGKLLAEARLYGYHENTFEDCRDQCLQHDNCLSFSWIKGASFKCLTYTRALAHQDFDQQEHGMTLYWDRECFIASCPKDFVNLEGTGLY